MNHTVRKIVASISVMIAMVMLSLPGSLHGKDADRGLLFQPFENAIAGSQSKTVRIYGAGIGREKGYATGIIVSGEGHILTARGVWLLSKNLRVMTHDGRFYTARQVKSSTKLQTALLKIETKTDDYFRLDRYSEALSKQGDWVLILSNAFQVAGKFEALSVNLGVITLRSVLASRHRTQDDPYAGDLLMYDAISNNPGSPGAAVVDINGALVGMAGKLLQAQSTQTRLNYAVPADQLHAFMMTEDYDDQAELEVKSAEPGDLGLVIFRLGGARSPAFVERVLPGSPAAKAGIRPDDMIVTVDGQTIKDIRGYDAFSAELKANQKIRILIKRGTQIIQTELVSTVRPE